MGDLVEEQGLPRRCRQIFSSRKTGLGIRAKEENSSTIRLRSPTWRMIVPVSCSKVAGVGADLLAVAALQPLGGELDRGQRVLDLVRDPAGDVGPGGAALVEQLLGNVVEGEDMAALDLHPLDGEGPRLAAGGELDDVLALLAVELARRARARARPACGRRRGPCSVLSRASAELLIRRTLRCWSSEMMPAVTPDSTASMKARRLSSWALAETRSPVCSSSRSVIRLNARPRPISSWTSHSVTRWISRRRPGRRGRRRSRAGRRRPARRPAAPGGRPAERDPDRKADDQERHQQQRRVEAELQGARARRASSDSRWPRCGFLRQLQRPGVHFARRRDRPPPSDRGGRPPRPGRPASVHDSPLPPAASARGSRETSRRAVDRRG